MRAFSLLLLFLFAGAGVTVSEAGGQEAGVILTVWDRTVPGAPPIVFTLESFEAIGLATLTTRTPWSDRPVVWQGVRLGDFLRHVGVGVGAQGRTLRITALNDFTADVPVSDAAYGPLLATRRDGQVMPVRDKGPIFLVYPYDQREELRSERIYARSVWQIRLIDIL